ncbi:MAG TPA: redoxin domain-containing protein [Planctomycetes bacterium]|nr:redoxin domain-containing protein [Fuerstiella sp.]HIK92757.1 redoxin domain-containing protein [Planctomycetota bacterium]
MRLSALLLFKVIVCGCGHFDSSSTVETRSVPQPTTSTTAVTVSLPNPVDPELPEDGSATAIDAVAETPQEPENSEEVTRLLDEMQQLRIAPARTELEQAKQDRRERNQNIVQMATRALQLTVDRESKQTHFNQAVEHLLEARFQLALNGAKEDIDQLYADVQALNDRNPMSEAAAEGVYYLARFAHTKARLVERSSLMWLQNFSRLAREFADRFPHQEQRAVSLLFGAGRSCEVHAAVSQKETDVKRLMTEAELCYRTLANKFGETSQGHEAAAVLRRLSLPGRKISQFAGPTLSGNYVDCENFRDQVTVIYFWDSENTEFQQNMLPLLLQANEVSSNRLRFVGVNLDEDESLARAFQKHETLPGEQIFFAEQDRRSWNSPLIRFWGVSRCPSVWLVDREGTVSAVDVGASQLVQQMRKLFE